MIYRKRAYTPPPLRRVGGITYTVSQTAPDGAVISISHTIDNRLWDSMHYPRKNLAAQLWSMRHAIRCRMHDYLTGVELP